MGSAATQIGAGNTSGRGTFNPGAQIRLAGTGFDLSFRLGDEVATVSGGGPTWTEEARPERIGLTSFDGEALVKLDVPVMLDGWRARRNVEPELDAILSLTRGDEGERPPDFIATGPFPYSGLHCVMAQPDFGDRMLGVDGVLYRQELTLHLIQFIDPDAITIERRDGGKAGSGKAKKTYTTKKGDTLISISTKLYKTPKHAKAIGDLNGIRDTRKKLKAGIVLKLPIPIPGTGKAAKKKADPPKKKPPKKKR